MRKFFLIILCFLTSFVFAQDQNYNFTFLPSGLHFMPLKANMQEAQIGLLYYPDNTNLKIDLGNSIDVFGFSWQKQKVELRLGVDLMAYALSKNYGARRFQIDALEGYFCGNATFSKIMGNHTLQLRGRLIHNSSHMVDGHFNNSTNKWKDDIEPIPYARNYGELTVADKIKGDNCSFRYYGTFAMAPYIFPTFQKKRTYSLGFEINFNELFFKIQNRDTNFFIAYQCNIRGNNEYIGENNIVSGIKLGNWEDKGLTFFVSYFTGYNYFNEYYQDRIKKFGIGLTIDFI